MATLEEMFFKEFNQMMSQRRAQCGPVDLYGLAFPEIITKGTVSQNVKAVVEGIHDEYYSKLNKTEAIVLSRPNLHRRKFDYKGEYIMKGGQAVLEEVDVPKGCVALVSDVKIGVPLKYNPRESFIFVDIVSKEKEDGSRAVKYIYIVPKKYCYKLNQVALIVSANKIRVYYSGIGLALQNGNFVYIYTIPYKPSKSEKNYRCLGTKTSIDFDAELNALRDYWLKAGVLFPYEACALMEGIKGRNNVAYEQFPQVLDTYVRYDPEKSLDTTEEEPVYEI